MGLRLLPAFIRTVSRRGLLNFEVHLQRNFSSVQFGIAFDIDGVIARGLSPLPGAAEGFHLLCDSAGHLKVPVVFLTNGFSLNNHKAKLLRDWLHISVDGDQVVQAHAPLRVFASLKDKHCLVIGQGPVVDIARNDIGIKNAVSIEDICAAYPLLDVVDHEKCFSAAALAVTESPEPPIVETIVIFGEPKNWETPLQLIIDLLLTNGRPVAGAQRCFYQTLPVIICNPDLQYMGRAPFPRFGNGAFLLCLEALFKKVTGVDLEYSAIIGKPSEVTYRYAEHCLTNVAHALYRHPQPLKTMYMIGDNTEVDIVGANLYGRYINGATIPASRGMPTESTLYPQTVTRIESILVTTGVHTANVITRSSPSSLNGNVIRALDDLSFMTSCSHQCHRDFVSVNKDLYKPSHVAENVLDAIRYIMRREHLMHES